MYWQEAGEISLDQDWLTVFEALKSIYQEGAYSNMALNEAISHHKGCRESFVRFFTKGTVMDTIRLDYIIDRLAAKGIRGIKKRTLIILRLGIYAIYSMESIPSHAAVNEAVSLAKKTARGTDRFVNGLLRVYIREMDSFRPETMPLSVRYSFPEDLAGLIEEQYGDETESILKGLSTPPPLVLRINSLKCSRSEAAEMLEKEGIAAKAADESEHAVIAEGSGVISSELYRKGLCSVQSLSSIQAIEALSPHPGSRVLDMCAAPGGKSGFMAELMQNRGSITACDIHEHRLGLIDAAMRRTGAEIVKTRLMDGTVHDENLDGSFDYVLADVPCSGLGVIGSKPEIKYRSDIASYAELEKIQRAILENAIRYTAEGGRTEYSTCTINKDENERLVNSVIEAYSFISIVEMRTILPYNCSVGFFYCILEKSQ